MSHKKISHVSRFALPSLIFYNDNTKAGVKFDRIILKQGNIIYKWSNPTSNIYIVYRLISRTNNSNIVLENCLFGAIKIKNITNPNPDKYEYVGYCGIGFDSKGIYIHPDGGYGKNVIIFGVDMSNSKHANNKTKNDSVLGRGFIQKIDYTTMYAETMYSSSFTVENKTFCLSLYYNGDYSYLFVNGKKVTKSKATITHKIFETNSIFQVKEPTTEKFSFLFFKSFILVSTKLSFWQEDWALGYDSMKFRHFPVIS